jgi:hypothetical protein
VAGGVAFGGRFRDERGVWVDIRLKVPARRAVSANAPRLTADAPPTTDSPLGAQAAHYPAQSDGPRTQRSAGGRVFFEPGENHWHGAAPNRFMVHVAMQQNDESGSPVTWGEHVSDEQYGAAPRD